MTFWAFPSSLYGTLGSTSAGFVLLAALFAPSAAAQDGRQQLDGESELGADVLRALADDDLDAALRTLGSAVDLSPALLSSDENSLSKAAGGVYRALSRLSTDQRYRLLHDWSLPPDVPRRTRILSKFVPQNAPPQVFARVLGERPRDSSFPVAHVGGIRGLFSTGWLLVKAADDTGRLRQLTAELEERAEQQVPHAEALLLLARIVNRSGDLQSVRDTLQTRAAQLAMRNAELETDNVSEFGDASNIVIAAAALERAELRPVSEEIFDLLVQRTYGTSAAWLRPHLRVAHATAVQLNRGESGPEVLSNNQLKYWVPTTGKATAQQMTGNAAAWLVHEDHILHLAGLSNDVLFFRYPLTGDFEFRCEAQTGDDIGSDGGLVYGGLQFETLGSDGFTVWDADLAHRVRERCPFGRDNDPAPFSRLALRSTAEAITFVGNLRSLWTDGKTSQASPWLGLRSLGERRPLFRNLKITGTPVIPREVHMSTGDQLRGWLCYLSDENQPAFADEAQPVVEDKSDRNELDWSIAAGEIQAAKWDAKPDVFSQSVLSYQRPLLDGEQVHYEYFYQPGEFDIHPALGRLAFLIESNGVRIHWITEDVQPWTGLPADNATLEPLNRRGPRPLPLRVNDWNQVTLARSEGTVAISLNDVIVYERTVDFGGDHLFGLYRDRTQSAAKVRHVVMTGDWPDTLPEQFLDNPVAVSDDSPSRRDSHALNEIFGDQLIAENVETVRRRAGQLDPVDRSEERSGDSLSSGSPALRTHSSSSGEQSPTVLSMARLAIRSRCEPRCCRGKPGRSGKPRGARTAIFPTCASWLPPSLSLPPIQRRSSGERVAIVRTE